MAARTLELDVHYVRSSIRRNGSIHELRLAKGEHLASFQ